MPGPRPRPDLDAQLIVRMPTALKRKLEVMAYRQDRSVAAEVRRALRAHIANHTDQGDHTP